MKYLGVDFGLRRIGLAVSEGMLASPWKIVEVKGLKDAVDKISKIITDEGFDKVIVGLPEGKMGQTVLKFINGLKKINPEVITADETLSSRQALEEMIGQNVPVKKRRNSDAVAAAIILQNYLDSI